jgi:hypothetical protein
MGFARLLRRGIGFDDLSARLDALAKRREEEAGAIAKLFDDVERRLTELAVRLECDRQALTQQADDELLHAAAKQFEEASEAAIERHGELVQLMETMVELGTWAHQFAGVMDEHLYAVLTDSGIRPFLRFAALAELQQRYQFVPGLTAYERKVTSQNGEDGVLLEILSRVGAPSKYFVEFGVGDGTEGNCVLLADAATWRGLFIESASDLFERLRGKYANNRGVQTVQALVTPESVEHLFEQVGVPIEPDVLSIDIDGGDYWVWEAITRYTPRIVVIEHNSALDADSRLVQPSDLERWDETDYFGASLAALADLGRSKGYRLAHVDMTGLNLFFVRDDLVWPDLVEPQPRSPNYLLVGSRHPADTKHRPYVDVTGRH